MPLVSILLFLFFILLSAFFNASETAFISSSPYTLDYLQSKGSKRAGRVKTVLTRVDDFLATILIGNTLVSVAAASLATSFIAGLVPHKNTAVLLATFATTVFLLFFAEINPKIYAAYNPLKLSFLLSGPIRVLMIAFFPFVKIFTFLSSRLFPSSKGAHGLGRSITEDETKVLLRTGVKGMSAFRKKMIAEILNIASRPVKEIMTPRIRIKAIEITAPAEQVLDTILCEEFSRFPVYRGRLDHIEGLIHTKDVIPGLIARKPLDLPAILRKPFFLPESVSVEKALIQLQENAVHMAFVVDEFGNMEGLVTLEDIIEEIVGDIQDEYDVREEACLSETADGAHLVKGATGIKDLNELLPLGIPESVDYTTLAGFFLYEFGRIPHEKDTLSHGGHRFTVEKMTKRHITLVRVEALRD